jgi:hypothetical protein
MNTLIEVNKFNSTQENSPQMDGSTTDGEYSQNFSCLRNRQKVSMNDLESPKKLDRDCEIDDLDFDSI